MRQKQGDSMVKVAVLDTGIESMHPAFAHANIVFRDFCGKEIKPIDLHGHGTHCAGVIHEIAPQAHLLVGRIAERSGMLTYDCLWDGLRWCEMEEADFVCICTGDRNRDQDVEKTIDKMVEKGTSVVVAVGNDGRMGGTGLFPSNMAAAIAVASLDENDLLLSFVNQPDNVELFGVSGEASRGPWTGGLYAERGGTSVAAARLVGWLANRLVRDGDRAFPEGPKEFLRKSGVRKKGTVAPYYVVKPQQFFSLNP
ncbi:MAG: S8 family serine peptidase [Cyclobacteriaceae bacterium]